MTSLSADTALSAVENVLARLRPAMAADGGNVEVLGVAHGIVHVRLTGACTMCPSADLTLHKGIEPALRQALPWVTGVTASPLKE